MIRNHDERRKDTAGAKRMRVAAPLLLLLAARASAASEHPSLLLHKGSLPAIQAKLTKPAFSARWARFLETAAEFCDAPVAGFDKVRDAQGICGVSAFAYAMTGQRRFAERAFRVRLWCRSAWDR